MEGFAPDTTSNSLELYNLCWLRQPTLQLQEASKSQRTFAPKVSVSCWRQRPLDYLHPSSAALSTVKGIRNALLRPQFLPFKPSWPPCPLDRDDSCYSIQAPSKRNYAGECFCSEVMGAECNRSTIWQEQQRKLKSPQLKLSTTLQCHFGSPTPNSLTTGTQHHSFLKKHVIAMKVQNQRTVTVDSPKGPWQSLSLIPSVYSWQNWGPRQQNGFF